MCVCVCAFFTNTDRHRGQPHPVSYAVANPIRGLLGRKKSEEHLQNSSASIKNSKKRQKTAKKQANKRQKKTNTREDNKWNAETCREPIGKTDLIYRQLRAILCPPRLPTTTSYSQGSQASLSTRPSPLRQSLRKTSGSIGYRFCFELGALTYLSLELSGESIITHEITYVNVRLCCTLLALGLSLTTSTLYRVL